MFTILNCQIKRNLCLHPVINNENEPIFSAFLLTKLSANRDVCVNKANKVITWLFFVAFADNAAGQGFSHLEFKILVEPPDGQSFSVVLLAPSRQEKAAWTSDISQVCVCWGVGVQSCDERCELVLL